MELNVIKRADTLEVQISGTDKIYILNHNDLKDELHWCQSIYHSELILDLSEIKFIDTTGFRLLQELNVNYKKAGRKLLLMNITDEAMELFELIKVKNLFEQYKPEEAHRLVEA